MIIKNLNLICRLDKKEYIELDCIDNQPKVMNFENKENGITAGITIEDIGEISIVRACARVNVHDFWEEFNFHKNAPLEIGVELNDEPEKILAYSLFNDWWTRPYFVDTYDKIPNRTQALLLQFKDYSVCLLPFAGNHCKTVIAGGGGGRIRLQMETGTGGVDSIEDISFIVTHSDKAVHALKIAMESAARLKGIQLRNTKKLPPMFRYLGWCSWDAFYTDVTEDKLLEKAEEFADKKIPVRWMLIDDGWLSVKNNRLQAFTPDEQKFPHGLKPLVDKIKGMTEVSWVGVWHTIAGYWGGVSESSELPEKVKQQLYVTRNKRYLPALDEKKAMTFWDDWYSYLSGQGIDFVKVDGQSSIKNHFENNEDVSYAASCTHRNLEAAVFKYFNGNIINCMGMSTENMLSRPQSALARNSDDFVPDNRITFAEHLIQNAYNCLYQGSLYYCDFDMFWSEHEEAYKHALLRALSGGPVYVSDKISHSSVDVLKKLAYGDGEILQFEEPPFMLEEDIYLNPEETGIVRILNRASDIIYMACFSIVDKSVRTVIDLSRLEGLKKDYYLYNMEKKIVKKISIHDTLVEDIDNYNLLQFIPCKDKVTPIGLIDKFLSGMTIVDFVEKDNSCQVTLREGGNFAFATEQKIQKIIVDNKDYTNGLVYNNGLYIVNTGLNLNRVTVQINY